MKPTSLLHSTLYWEELRPGDVINHGYTILDINYDENEALLLPHESNETILIDMCSGNNLLDHLAPPVADRKTRYLTIESPEELIKEIRDILENRSPDKLMSIRFYLETDQGVDFNGALDATLVSCFGELRVSEKEDELEIYTDTLMLDSMNKEIKCFKLGKEELDRLLLVQVEKTSHPNSDFWFRKNNERIFAEWNK